MTRIQKREITRNIKQLNIQDLALAATFNQRSIGKFLLCIVPFLTSFTTSAGYSAHLFDPSHNGINIDQSIRNPFASRPSIKCQLCIIIRNTMMNMFWRVTTC